MTGKMEALLSVIMFVVLPYYNNDALIPSAEKTTPSDKPQPLGVNIEPRRRNLTAVVTSVMTTAPEAYLVCHKCSGDHRCTNPTKCTAKEKFCVFTKLVSNRKTFIKYCSVTCPFQNIRTRSYMFYTACCVTDLCNYRVIGEGHAPRVCIPVVAMTFMAYFIEAFQIEL